MRLTQTQAAAVDLLRARLDTGDRGFAGSAEVRVALDSIRPYLDSYILPLLDNIERGDQWHGQGATIKGDASAMRRRRGDRR